MLNVDVNKNEFGKIINISNKENAFEIIYGGNLDLYFNPVMNRMELFDQEESIVFEIEKDDEILYSAFLNLYEKIILYSAFDDDSNENCEYERKKDSLRNYPLVHDGIISWHSDESIPEESSILNIRKEEDTIILEFEKSHSEEMFMPFSIRFRNSGSNYDPFNNRFMELYNNLCKIYFSEEKEKLKKLENKIPE